MSYEKRKLPKITIVIITILVALGVFIFIWMETLKNEKFNHFPSTSKRGAEIKRCSRWSISNWSTNWFIRAFYCISRNSLRTLLQSKKERKNLN